MSYPRGVHWKIHNMGNLEGKFFSPVGEGPECNFKSQSLYKPGLFKTSLEFLVCKVGACQFFCLLLRLGLHFLEVQSQHIQYLDRRNHCTLAWGGGERHLSWFLGTPLKPKGNSLKIQTFRILLIYWRNF